MTEILHVLHGRRILWHIAVILGSPSLFENKLTQIVCPVRHGLSLLGLVLHGHDRLAVTSPVGLFKLLQEQDVDRESCIYWGLFPAQRTIEDILVYFLCTLNEPVDAIFAIIVATVG